MATLTLTDLDRELLNGLQVLTDQEIGRVQAHLAAGLPMRIGFGWDDIADTEPACFGCLVGTAMSPAHYYRELMDGRSTVRGLAYETFPAWARSLEGWERVTFANWSENIGQSDNPLGAATRDRLAALLDMEWSRRHPVVNSAGQELEHNNPTSPSLLKEAVHA